MRDNQQTKCTPCTRRCERQDGPVRQGEERALWVTGHLGTDGTSCRKTSKRKARGGRAGCIRAAAWRPPSETEGGRQGSGQGDTGAGPLGPQREASGLGDFILREKGRYKRVLRKGVTSLKGSARPLCRGWLRAAMWGQGDQPERDGAWERAVGGLRSSWILDSC